MIRRWTFEGDNIRRKDLARDTYELLPSVVIDLEDGKPRVGTDLYWGDWVSIHTGCTLQPDDFVVLAEPYPELAKFGLVCGPFSYSQQPARQDIVVNLKVLRDFDVASLPYLVRVWSFGPVLQPKE